MNDLKRIKVTIECEGMPTQVFEGNTVLISVTNYKPFESADASKPNHSHCAIQGDYLALCRLLTHQAMHVASFHQEAVEGDGK